MTPKFMRKLHAKRSMRYRVNWSNWLFTLFLLAFLLLSYLFASWMDESARLVAAQRELSQREGQIIALLRGEVMSQGDGHYTECTTERMIPKLVEGI